LHIGQLEPTKASQISRKPLQRRRCAGLDHANSASKHVEAKTQELIALAVAMISPISSPRSPIPQSSPRGEPQKTIGRPLGAGIFLDRLAALIGRDPRQGHAAA